MSKDIESSMDQATSDLVEKLSKHHDVTLMVGGLMIGECPKPAERKSHHSLAVQMIALDIHTATQMRLIEMNLDHDVEIINPGGDLKQVETFKFGNRFALDSSNLMPMVVDLYNPYKFEKLEMNVNIGDPRKREQFYAGQHNGKRKRNPNRWG